MTLITETKNHPRCTHHYFQNLINNLLINKLSLLHSKFMTYWVYSHYTNLVRAATVIIFYDTAFQSVSQSGRNVASFRGPCLVVQNTRYFAFITARVNEQAYRCYSACWIKLFRNGCRLLEEEIFGSGLFCLFPLYRNSEPQDIRSDQIVLFYPWTFKHPTVAIVRMRVKDFTPFAGKPF